VTLRVEYRRGSSPDALADLPDGCADAVVTDPPFGTQTKTSLYGRRRPGDREGRTIAHDTDLTMLEANADLWHRVLRRFGVVLCFAAPTRRSEVEAILEDAGFRIDGFAPWDKGNPGISYRVRYGYEDVVIASHFGTDDPWHCRDPLVTPLREPRVPDPVHPHEKPVALLRRYIAWACPTGGLVLDPFAGIASCGVAAIAEGCSYIGVECDERWWNIAERRIAEAQDRPHPDTCQPSLFTSDPAA
jgi:DNA modification methylase